MEFFKPEVTLTKIINLDAPDEYELTTKTVCDKSNYCATGHDVSKQLNAEGNLEVLLFIGQDSTIAEIGEPITIEHFVMLGKLPSVDEGMAIEVIVKTSPQETTEKGKTKVKTASADEHDRPVIER